MSPEASTARPERASTLRRTRRSIPAMPIALSRAPIVVGISATSKEINVVSEIAVPEKRPNGRSVTTTIMKIRVRPARRMPRAISLGVLRRAAPSTRAIIRSRKDWPGSWVISTTMRSESTRVPPVTALRSPPDSRMTGADSPVMADSSTEAIPSMTVPSPGISSPAATSTMSPLTSSEAERSVPSASLAIVSWRVARRVSACARPRPSANASARLANATVSHSQTEMVSVYQPGSWPPPSDAPPKAWITQLTVVMSAPSSTTNMTGLRICTRGSSLVRLSSRARRTMSPCRRETARRSADRTGGGAGAVVAAISGRLPTGPARG